MLTDKPASSWYRSWFNSPYYHLLYEKRDDREAADFIDKLIFKIKPSPSANMLDIGCGKGRHSRMLAAKGYHVTGIDISEESIEEARRSGNERLEFLVHDMRQPFRINHYDFVFNFFTSFGYFNTQEEHHQAIKTFAQSLKKEGILVIDYLNVDYVESHLVKSSDTTKNNITFQIKRWSDQHHFFKNILVSDPGENAEPFSFTEKVAKFTLEDFRNMLAKESMQIADVFGTYDLQPYHIHESPRLILLAKKV